MFDTVDNSKQFCFRNLVVSQMFSQRTAKINNNIFKVVLADL